MFAIPKTHDLAVNKIITLIKDGEENRFASCSSDTKIFIWNLYKPKQIKTPLMILEGHSQAVKNIIQIANQDLIVSASRNETGKEIKGEVKIWNIEQANPDNPEPLINNQPLQTFENIVVGYQNSLIEITKLEGDEIKNGDLMCGCIDGTVCILKKNPNSFDYQLTQKIQHPWFTIKTANDKITGGGVSAFNLLQDGSVIAGCPNGGFVQIYLNKKSAYEILGQIQKEIINDNIVAFANIKIKDRIFYYAVTYSGKLIEYNI